MCVGGDIPHKTRRAFIIAIGTREKTPPPRSDGGRVQGRPCSHVRPPEGHRGLLGQREKHCRQREEPSQRTGLRSHGTWLKDRSSLQLECGKSQGGWDHRVGLWRSVCDHAQSADSSRGREEQKVLMLTSAASRWGLLWRRGPVRGRDSCLHAQG